VPEFSPSYRTLCQSAIVRLKNTFGDKRISDIAPNDIHQYLNTRSKKSTVNGRTTGGNTIANREIEVLQNAFSWAVFSKGYLSRHPFKDQIKFLPEKARTRYIEDWEITEMMTITSNRRKGSFHAVKAYIKIKLLTGMAKGDLLRLTELDLREDGIHIQRHKVAHSTGKRTIYLWSEDLRQAIKEAIATRPARSTFLFCKKNGACYFNEKTGRAEGWESIWERFKKAVMEQTKVTENFTDHDLRAKTGSDAISVEEASKMLSHADTAVTRKHYRRKPDKVPTGAR
jgi:integrase